MKIKYKRLSVEVDLVKPTVCPCCGKTPKPRGMNLHHFAYNFTTEQVKKYPSLAKLNTIWLCYSCHRVGNAARILMDNEFKSKKIIELMENAIDSS